MPMNMTRPIRAGLLLAAACGGLAACGSSSHTAAPTTLPAPTTPAAKQPTLTLVPSGPFPSQSAVRILAAGFSPGESLVVTECANKGSATSEGDCDLATLKAVTADSSGKVQATFTVTKGPFGTNHITCSKPGSCLVSVSQPTPNPTQVATAPLTFS